MVSLTQVIEVRILPPGTSAQLAETIALTQTLTLAENKSLNVYTDSKYAFLVLHAHAAIWKERGYLMARNNPIKYGPQILSLLEAVLKPSQVAVIHCRSHERG